MKLEDSIYQNKESFRVFSQRRWLQILLLLGWIVIGTILRFTNLAAKPPWNDEFATLVFSLGNSYHSVPIDQAISLDPLLQPLQPNPNAGISDVIQNLMTQSTHPPVYFVLTHLWLKLFPLQDGLASIWAARSLSAILGVAAIPAIFGLSWLAFRSVVVGQIAAAIMAVSPFGIFLAQEARHYTLVILVIIASLCCLVTATQHIQHRIPLPIWLALTWIVINSLGIAIHYFFTLTLCAQALVLLRFWIQEQKVNNYPHWRRFYAVAGGTLISGLVWLPVWQNVPGNQVTQWIFDSNPVSNLLEPIARLLAWIITMVALLPIEGTTLPITIISGFGLISFSCWILVIIARALKYQGNKLETQLFEGYIFSAIALLFIITYSLGADLTIAARYQFFYFPAVLVKLALTLAVYWNADSLKLPMYTHQQYTLNNLIMRRKKVIVIVLILGLCGSLTVISNFGYQKPDRPDLLVPIIQKVSQVPTLIATAYFTHEQIGEMMGLALKFRQSNLKPSTKSKPLFLLSHLKPDTNTSIETLQKIVNQLPKPLDLWVINFFPTPEPAINNCTLDRQTRPKMNGYKHRLYHCL